MRGVVVALDLETTGLDPEIDQIIEIGIIRCQDDQILDEFHSLIDPGIPIPSKVTAITGIKTTDVSGHPRLDAILPQIREFVGNSPIIAHNISFDLGFLQRHGVGVSNTGIDTYELASVLLPTAPRYSLGSLVEQFGLNLDNAHRALDDTIAAWQVYRRLWAMLQELPLEVVRNR